MMFILAANFIQFSHLFLKVHGIIEEGDLKAKTAKEESVSIHRLSQLLFFANSIALIKPDNSAIKEDVLPKHYEKLATKSAL
jgi:hypothetical protein